MRKTLPMILVLAAGLSLTAAMGSRAQNPTAGFMPLFNGKSLEGWRVWLDPKAKDANPDQVFTVKGGEIHCIGRPNGYIITDNEYGDYVLKVQWRWPEGTGQRANSGVFVHVSGPDKIWPKGVEAQLASGAAGDFWLVDGFTMSIPQDRQDPLSARHYLRIGERWEKGTEKDKQGRVMANAIRKSVEKPLGEWNQYEITCQGDRVKLMVNGQLVNEGSNAEQSRGKILLQSEGSPIQFRNIEIKPLR